MTSRTSRASRCWLEGQHLPRCFPFHSLPRCSPAAGIHALSPLLLLSLAPPSQDAGLGNLVAETSAMAVRCFQYPCVSPPPLVVTSPGLQLASSSPPFQAVGGCRGWLCLEQETTSP